MSKRVKRKDIFELINFQSVTLNKDVNEMIMNLSVIWNNETVSI